MRNWIPNQHGAWAFVITPTLLGGLLAGFRWEHALLLLGWLSAYCFNFYIGMTVKSWRRTDRFSRYRKQQVVYGAVATLAAAILLWRIPYLLVAGLALLPVFIANLWFISRRNERAWLNDMLGVLAAVFMGGVALKMGEVEIGNAQWVLLALLFAYFAGTVLYVKTMIRERGEPYWLLASRCWHLAAAMFAAVFAPLQLLVFIPALARAWLFPARKLSAKQVGVFEVFLTVGLAAIALL